MKKHLILLALLVSALGITGCGNSSKSSTYDYGKNYLALVNLSYTADKDYFPVSEYSFSRMETTKDKWIGKIYKKYTFNGYRYSNGVEFVDDAEKVNEYVKKHDFDSDEYVTNEGSYFKHHKTWYIYAYLEPIEYNVTYLGLENARHPDYPSTYTANDRAPLTAPVREKYTFKGWKIIDAFSGMSIGTSDSYPYNEPRDIAMEAIWEATVYNVTYKVPSGISNPNTITQFTSFSDPFTLQDIPSTKYYSFGGWYLNGEKVTTITPSTITGNITLEAKITYNAFTIQYLVDGNVYKSDTLTIASFENYTMPAVPEKEHFTGAWDYTISELDNIVVNAVYTPKTYTVSVVTNIDDFTVEDISITYGDTFEKIYDAISYPDKALIGIYKDQSLSTLLEEDALIDGNMTIYLKWQNVIHISTVEQFGKIPQDPAASYILDTDLDFLGNPIPSIDTFKGTLDGNGHSIYDFINQHPSTGASNALIVNNKGTIKNITFKEGMYTSSGAGHASDTHQAFLTITNSGTIENVKVESCNFSLSPYYSVAKAEYSGGSQFSGILAAINTGAIKNVKVDSNTAVTVLAKAHNLKELNWSDSRMQVNSNFGGIVGDNRGTIENASFEGSLSSSLTWTESVTDIYAGWVRNNYYYLYLAGIAGLNSGDGIIKKSLFSGSIFTYIDLSLHHAFYPYVISGSICGNNNNKVINCVSTETAELRVGGIYEIRAGGLVGNNDVSGAVQASLSKARFNIHHSQTSACLYLGGIVGFNKGSISYCGAYITSYGSLTHEDNKDYFGLFAAEFAEGATAVRSFVIFPHNVVNESFTNFKFGRVASSTGALMNYVYINPAVAESFYYDGVGAVTDADSLETMLSEEILATKLGLKNQGISIDGESFPTIIDAGFNN